MVWEGADYYEKENLLLIYLYNFVDNNALFFGKCSSKGKNKVACQN